MSENIQSISQGTYTIGNTNELTFSAGPGISIDSPSEGVVRIGADETVLWENPDNSTNSNISCSEPLSSFDYIRFEYALSLNSTVSNWAYNDLSSIIPTRNLMVNKRFCLNGMIPDATASGTLVIRNMIYTVSNDAKTLTFDKAYQLYFNGSSWTTGSSNVPVYKVVGINRIANN